MFKSMKEVRNHFESVVSKSLYTGLIYYYSPISESVEERHIYADANSECIFWLDNVCENINKYSQFEYKAYLNGNVYKSKGEVFDNIYDNFS